jgi:hypothetical protein
MTLRAITARAVLLASGIALAGCGYIVTPHDDATPTPAIAGGLWSAVATSVEEVSGSVHADLTIRNDTGAWSAMSIDDGGSVKLVGSNGDTVACGTAFVGTGGTALPPGFSTRGYTAGTKMAPEIQLLRVECDGGAVAAGSKLAIAYTYTAGDFNYYSPTAPRSATLQVDLEQPVVDLTYPGTVTSDVVVSKVGEPIDAINKNTVTLTAAARTGDTIEFTWDTQNPTKYPVYVHIGIPPVIGSDGVIYGRYQSPHLADTPITPATGSAEWTTSVTVPAAVTGLYVLPSVESKQQKNFTSHVIDITDK